MDSQLVRQALEYHGEGLSQYLREEQEGPPGGAPQTLQQPQADTFTDDRDSYFNQRLLKFLAKKADLLYRETNDDTTQTGPELEEDDFYAIMPPLETFMGIPPECSRYHLFNSLEKRDVVIGVVSTVLDSGLVVTLLCMDKGKCRDLDHLKITAFCPVKELPKDYGSKSPVDAFQVKDKVRGVVISVNPETEKIILSLMKKALPADTACPNLGVINDDEFPVYYRRHLQIRGVTYDELLHSIMGFNNSYCVPYLAQQLGVETDTQHPPSLMRALHRLKIVPSECAEGLRKAQSAKWAMKSVAEGVAYFKAGKSMEAMQLLNKALQVDMDNVEALVARGALYANNESYSKAIDDFKLALKTNPNHGNARKYLHETLIAKGRELHDSGSYDEAEVYYHKALQLNRADPEVIHYLRLCHRHEPVQISHPSRVKFGQEDSASGSSSQQDFPLSQTKERLLRLIEEDERGRGSKRLRQASGDWPTSPGGQQRTRKVSEPKYERMTSVSPSECRGRPQEGRSAQKGSEEARPGRRPLRRGRGKSRSPDSPDSSRLYRNSSSSSSSSSGSSSSGSSSSSSGSSSSDSSSDSSRSPSPRQLGQDRRAREAKLSKRAENPPRMLSQEMDIRRHSKGSFEDHNERDSRRRSKGSSISREDHNERHDPRHSKGSIDDYKDRENRRRSKGSSMSREDHNRRHSKDFMEDYNAQDSQRHSKGSREDYYDIRGSEFEARNRQSKRSPSKELGVEEARRVLASKRKSVSEKDDRKHRKNMAQKEKVKDDIPPGDMFRNSSPPGSGARHPAPDTDVRTYNISETLSDNKSKSMKFMEYLETKHNPSVQQESPAPQDARERSSDNRAKESPAGRSTPGIDSANVVTPDRKPVVGSPVCRKTRGLVVRGNPEEMPTHFRAGVSGGDRRIPVRKSSSPAASNKAMDSVPASSSEGQAEPAVSKNKLYDDIKIQVRNDKFYTKPQESQQDLILRTVSGAKETGSYGMTAAGNMPSPPSSSGRGETSYRKEKRDQRFDATSHKKEQRSLLGSDDRSRSQSVSGSTGRPGESEQRKNGANLPDVVESARKYQGAETKSWSRDKHSPHGKKTHSRSRSASRNDDRSDSLERHGSESRDRRSTDRRRSHSRDRRFKDRRRSESNDRRYKDKRRSESRDRRSTDRLRSHSRDRRSTDRRRSHSGDRRSTDRRRSHSRDRRSTDRRRSHSRDRRSTDRRRSHSRDRRYKDRHRSKLSDRRRSESRDRRGSHRRWSGGRRGSSYGRRDRKRARSSSSSSSSSKSSSSSSSGSSPPLKKSKTEGKNSVPSTAKKSAPNAAPPAKSGLMMYLPRQLQVKSASPAKPGVDGSKKTATPTPSATDTTKTKQQLKEMEDFLSQLKEKKKQQLIQDGVFEKYKKPT